MLAGWLLLTVLALPGLFQLRLDNSAERFFVDDAEALAQYRHASELLRSRVQGVRVVVFGDELWTEGGLRWLASFETKAPRIQGVAAAAGLYGHHRLDARRLGVDGSVALWPPSDIEAFRRRVLSDPLDLHAGWVTPDGAAASVLVAVDDPAQSFLDEEGPERLRGAVEELRRLAETAPPGVEVAMAGLPMVNQALDEEMERMMRTVFPWFALVAALGLVIGLRRKGEALMGLAYVLVCETVTLGLAGRAGLRLDLVTVVLLPLLFVVALATAVHVLMEFRRRRGTGSVAEAVLETFRVKSWPVLLTGVTTAVGFGSLTLSPVPPIRSLGAWSAFGLALSTFAAFTLLPALIALRRLKACRRQVQQREGGGRSGRWGAGWGVDWGGRWATWSIRRRRMVFGAFAVGALVAVAGLPRLHVDTNLLSYFAPEHTLHGQLATVEGFGFGSAQVDLWIECEPGSCAGFDVADRLDQLDQLGRLTRALRLVPGVRGAIGPDDVRLWILEPDGRTWFRWQAVLQTLPPPGHAARIALFAPSSSPLAPVLDRAESLAKEAFPNATVWVTGPYPLVVAAQRSLLRTMWLSLGTTALAIAVILLLVSERLAYVMVALAASLWPVLVVLGSLGWTGVPVEATTVMIAAVVLGLSVDDTLHVFGHLRHRQASPRPDPRSDIVSALGLVAPSLALSTAILVVGFLACAGSDLMPVARFGLLSAAALVLALGADLLLVPAALGPSSGRASEQENDGCDGQE